MKTRVLGVVGSVMVAMMASASAQVVSPQDEANPDRWRFALAPYFWAPSVKVDAKVHGVDIEDRVPFSEIWDDLQFGGMLKGEARTGRFGILTDVFYVSLKDKSDVTTPGGIPLFNTDAKLYLWVAELDGSYEVARWGEGKEQGSLDVLAGGRYWNVEHKLDASVPITGGSRSFDGTLDWIDAIVGTRLNLDVTENLHLIAQGDIGGFDIGTSAKLDWCAQAYLGWKFSELFSAWAGWKYLFVDYSQNSGNDMKVTFSGPAVGVAFSF